MRKGLILLATGLTLARTGQGKRLADKLLRVDRGLADLAVPRQALNDLHGAPKA